MIATDFIYDGTRLTELGYMICQFDEAGGFQTATAGSQLVWSKVPQNGGRTHLLAGTKYDSCFETDISICKPDGSTFSVDEYAFLMRWLNRAEYHELYIGMEPDKRSTSLHSRPSTYVNNVGEVVTIPEMQMVTLGSYNLNVKTSVSYEYDDIHFLGTFNVDRVEFRGRLIGFVLHFTSDGPFGYGAEKTFTFNLTPQSTNVINDISDEVGYIYPSSLTVTCKEAGDLVITNSIEGRRTAIDGVSKGEVITFDETMSIIETSLSSHKVMNDFNFTFFRIANTYDNRRNVISANLNCKISLTYTPRRKVVF